MSRIGRKPVTVPANVKVSIADSTIQVEGPKGKLSFSPSRVDRRRSYDEAGKQVLVTRADDERENRALHGLTRSLIANMVEGVTDRLHQEARDRRRRLSGPAEEGEHRRPPGRLRQPGRAGSPGRRQRGRPRPDAHHDHRRPTSRPSASSPPWSARSARPSLTRARASATKAKSSAARPARPSAPSKSTDATRRVIDITPTSGLGVRSGSAAPEPPSCREGSSGESAQDRRSASPPPPATRPQAAPRNHRAAPAGGVPELQAHLCPGRQRRHRHHAGLGQHARPRGQGAT